MAFSFNRLIIIFIISGLVSVSFEQINLKNKIHLRNLQATTSTVPTTIPTSIDSTIMDSDIDSTIEESTIPIEPTDLNSTTYVPNIKTKKSSGLSAGSIIAIIVPCVAAVGGIGAVYVLTRGRSVPTTTTTPVNFESSMQQFNTQPNNGQVIGVQTPEKVVQVIQPNPIVEQQPIYPIKKEEPQILNNNIIPQPIDTVQPITSTNISVPIQGANEIMVSQNQLIPNNNAIKIINAPEQIIPQNNVSLTNPSTSVIPIV
jgi:hypothetical protein